MINFFDNTDNIVKGHAWAVKFRSGSTCHGCACTKKNDHCAVLRENAHPPLQDVLRWPYPIERATVVVAVV